MSNIKPIIITGMHRSGSSLITQILNKYIYIGSKIDINYESIYFQRINRWLLSCNSCSWDNPSSFNYLNDNELDILISQLKNDINKKIPTLMYFGIRNIFYNKSFNNFKSIWGWKDPANVFTLYLWSKIFSNIKVINITRNPLDVAESLLNRQFKLTNIDKKSKYNNLLTSLIPLLSINKGNVYSSFKINNINDCLKLYKKYYDQMLLNNDMFPEILNIRYEHLLSDSCNQLKIIYDFCDIESNSIKDDAKIIEAINALNPKNNNKIHINYSSGRVPVNDKYYLLPHNDWEKHLTIDQQYVIEEMSKSFFIKAGYNPKSLQGNSTLFQ